MFLTMPTVFLVVRTEKDERRLWKATETEWRLPVLRAVIVHGAVRAPSDRGCTVKA